MIPALSNEFNQDNRVRPYTTGVTRHDEYLSTILLYQEGEREAALDDETQAQYDYLDNLERTVQDLSTLGVDGEKSTGDILNDPGDIAIVQLDGSNNYYGVFNNFSLTSVQEGTEQIQSVHVNFGGSWNAFFFGEKPRVYQFGGFFIDSQEYPFYQEFFMAYEKYLSGRKTIENKMKTKFIYDGKIIDGYMLGISASHTAEDQLVKRFEFTVLVRSVTWVRTNVIYGTELMIDDKGTPYTGVTQKHALNGMSNSIRNRSWNLVSQVLDSSRQIDSRSSNDQNSNLG